MRCAYLIPTVFLLSACSLANRILGETGDDETGAETSDGETSETGAPLDMPTYELGPCWTAQRTSYDYLYSIDVDAEHILVHSSDGLWVEAQGDVSLDPSLTGLPAMLTKQIIGDPDDLWLVDAGLWHWDGATLSDQSDDISDNILRETPSGELWRLGLDGVDPSQLALLSYEGQGFWQTYPIPALDHAELFEVGEGSQWLVEVNGLAPMRLASRIDDGEWFIEDIPMPLIATSDPDIGLSDLGGVFVASPLVDCSPLVGLAYRDPAGSWHTSELDVGELPGQCLIEVNVVGEVAYLHPSLTQRVWRWDGLGQPTVFDNQLPSKKMRLRAGGGRLVGVVDSPSPAFYELNPGPDLSIELIEEFPSFGGGPTAGVSLDAMFTGSPDQLQRWNGAAWTRLADNRAPGWTVQEYEDLWAASPTTAFAIARGEGSGHFPLSRWEDNELAVWSGMDPGPQFLFVWGRSESDVWAVGHVPSGCVFIHCDGNYWTDPLGFDSSPPIALTGDAEQLYLADIDAQVWAYVTGDDPASLDPVPLGAPLAEHADSGDLAVFGQDGEFLLAAQAWNIDPGLDQSPIARVFMVWDGAQWSNATDQWPEGPSSARSLYEDGAGGVFVITADSPEELWYGDGENWESIEYPEGGLSGYVAAAPEGLLVVESRAAGQQQTREFRWSCE